MFKQTDIKYKDFDLKFFKSDIFSDKLIHLLTTRTGGDTPKPLADFTMSAKDYREFENFAQKNQKAVCDIIGADYEKLVLPNQQHSDKILVLKDKLKEFDKNEPFDGVVTNIPNIPVMLVFADCIPILLFDNKNNVMSIVHAGWKGSAKKIAPKAVQIMYNEFGCSVENISAIIGAGISGKRYETSPENIEILLMTINKKYAKDVVIEGKNIDLKKLNALQLQETGIENIDICPFCTYDNNDLFYSYRRENKTAGRHALIGMIKE